MKELSIAVPISENFTANFLMYESVDKSRCKFFVSVLDQYKKGHFFWVQQLGQNGWKIKSNAKLPEWILDLENKLNEMISNQVDLAD